MQKCTLRARDYLSLGRCDFECPSNLSAWYPPNPGRTKRLCPIHNLLLRFGLRRLVRTMYAEILNVNPNSTSALWFAVLGCLVEFYWQFFFKCALLTNRSPSTAKCILFILKSSLLGSTGNSAQHYSDFPILQAHIRLHSGVWHILSAFRHREQAVRGYYMQVCLLFSIEIEKFTIKT